MSSLPEDTLENESDKKNYSKENNCLHILIALSVIGLNFPYDLPMNLSDELKLKKSITDELIQNLYSAYSITSIFLCIAIGFMLRYFT